MTGRLSWLNLVLFAISVSIIPLLTFIFNSSLLRDPITRFLSGGMAVLAGGFFLRAWYAGRKIEGRSRGGWVCLAASLTLSSCLYIILSYLPEISNTPFTLTWSEASRYYYASLFFSKRIYGEAVPPTVLHPSRYLLQSLPFLIPDSPIWLHRAWQALLWVAAPMMTATVLARRLAVGDCLYRWIFIGAAFLYMMTAPVYYHLLVPAILVLWGFKTDPAGENWQRWIGPAAVVFAASIWAGISRVNWFPVPGCLAALLILLETPIQPLQTDHRYNRSGSVWRYSLRLVGWVFFGTITAFGAQLLYIYWSGNSAEQFTTSFSSSLLWHRLLPNETYPLGILPAIAIVALPLVLVILGRLIQPSGGRPAWQNYHPIRLLGIAVILAVFFCGGILVSVKIGGGSNIHNMDAFLVLLLVVSAVFLFERTGRDSETTTAAPIESRLDLAVPNRLALDQLLVSAGLALGLVIFPLFTIPSRQPAGPAPDPQEIADGLATISEAARATIQTGGSILFISNRQLLTFHNIEAPLIPDYERVFLMEVAMAGDQAYLARFQEDLKNHRFDLIVSEPISLSMKEGAGNFAAENNAWVKNVSRYLLCYYEPVKTLRKVQVQLLVPSPDTPENCR